MDKKQKLVDKLCMHLVSNPDMWVTKKVSGNINMLEFKDAFVTDIAGITLTFRGRDIPLSDIQRQKLREAFLVCLELKRKSKSDYEIMIEEIDNLLFEMGA